MFLCFFLSCATVQVVVEVFSVYTVDVALLKEHNYDLKHAD